MPVSGPLQNIRILDLTHVWAGPLAVRFLADMGAQVVKVEAPLGRGPRQYPAEPIGGFLGGAPGDEPWNVNAVFNKLNRNRQSLCVDLKSEQGKGLLLELVAAADVIIENFSARAMPSMGLSYEVLSAANPQIIYVSMPGFGSHGPYRDRVAFGPTVEPMSGLTNMLGYDEDHPQNTAMALMDPIAATHAAAAVVEALQQRKITHTGCYVELSLHEAGVNYSGAWLVDSQLGAFPRCMGNGHPNMAPHGVYACQGHDEWLALACVNETQWRSLCGLIEGLDVDLDLDARLTAQANLNQAISAWTSQHTKAAAANLLQACGVAAGPVYTTPEMLADSQVQARGFFVPYERFDTPMPGNPIHMSGLSSDEWTACPDLGADNAAVLRDWLDYDDRQIKALETQGILADKPPG